MKSGFLRHLRLWVLLESVPVALCKGSPGRSPCLMQLPLTLTFTPHTSITLMSLSLDWRTNAAGTCTRHTVSESVLWPVCCHRTLLTTALPGRHSLQEPIQPSYGMYIFSLIISERNHILSSSSFLSLEIDQYPGTIYWLTINCTNYIICIYDVEYNSGLTLWDLFRLDWYDIIC